jgi:hypothetical protein
MDYVLPTFKYDKTANMDKIAINVSLHRVVDECNSNFFNYLNFYYALLQQITKYKETYPAEISGFINKIKKTPLSDYKNLTDSKNNGLIVALRNFYVHDRFLRPSCFLSTNPNNKILKIYSSLTIYIDELKLKKDQLDLYHIENIVDFPNNKKSFNIEKMIRSHIAEIQYEIEHFINSPNL